MNTCGTCRFFGPKIEGFYDYDENGDEIVTPTFHRCLLLQHLNDYDNKALKLTAVAGVMDGSGYHATMCVREEFGCNQWQPVSEEAEHG